jgi:cell division protein FtsZ
MNDRNAYAASQSNEDAVTHSHQEEVRQQQPSRLIQSIRDAANRYENPSRPQTSAAPAPKAEPEVNNRAKSIAEKLGFINFDEDEFDTPSYLRKEEKTEQVAPRSTFKGIDL